MQHKMSQEGVDCCRLCSSKKNLISMFSGKSRTIRDCLRKMIEETVHIQVEQCDAVASICFNCSVDVSNFYFFKLNCLNNEKHFRDIRSSPKMKRLKLQSLHLKEIPYPDIKATETVLNWLCSKRGEITDISLDKDTQTVQIHCDIATQSDKVEIFSKYSQTIQPKLVNSKIQCDEIKPSSPHKLSVKSQSTQTRSTIKQNSYASSSKNKNLTSQIDKPACCEKSSQTSNRVVKRLSQIDIFNPDLIKFKETCQTNTRNVPNNFPQTVQNNSTQVPKVHTQERSAQTKEYILLDKGIQCDFFMINGFKNSAWQTKGHVGSIEDRNKDKIADPHTFTDALLNGFDNIFVSKTTQTEMISHPDLVGLSNSYFNNKDSYLLSPSTNPFSKDVHAKLNIKTSFPEIVKEETISPVQSLMISIQQSPDNRLLSPQSSDLLQIDHKADLVKICKLCDKTLYNKKEVVMHNKTHMQCTICKRKFRSLKAMQNHINGCKVKQYNLLFVRLDRIDQIAEVKEKYFKAL